MKVSTKQGYKPPLKFVRAYQRILPLYLLKFFHVQATHTNGSGKTLKTIQKSGPDGEITTSFEYDGIRRLVRVTGTEGNVMTSTYDMGEM